jgi:hypothetical protein
MQSLLGVGPDRKLCEHFDGGMQENGDDPARRHEKKTRQKFCRWRYHQETKPHILMVSESNGLGVIATRSLESLMKRAYNTTRSVVLAGLLGMVPKTPNV